MRDVKKIKKVKIKGTTKAKTLRFTVAPDSSLSLSLSALQNSLSITNFPALQFLHIALYPRNSNYYC